MTSEQHATIRETIQLLSQILSSCGCPKLPSEVFRKAKFNQPSVTRELWQLLSHTVRISNALDKGRAPEIPFTSIADSSLPYAALQVRGYLLVSLGYTRSAFFSVNYSHVNSRELLLAFGWLLHQSKLFLRLKTYHAAAASTLTSTFPFSAAGRKSREHVEQDCERFRKQLETLLGALQSCCDTKGAKNAIQVLIWVRGKLLAQWKAAALGQLAYQKLANAIHKSTQVAHSGETPSHLSVHEMFLLKHPKHMAIYAAKTEKHLNVLERLLVWELEHETIFWQWIQSVLDQESEMASMSETDMQGLVRDVEELKAQVHQLECELNVPSNDRDVTESTCHKKKRCSESQPPFNSEMQELAQRAKHISLESDSKAKSLEPSLEGETLSPLDQARFVPKQLPMRKANHVGGNSTDSLTAGRLGGDVLSEEVIHKLKVELCEQLLNT